MSALVPSWAAEFIGVPYERMDCYALVRAVYSGQLGVVLPAVVLPESDDARRAAITANRSGAWEPIARGSEDVLDVAEISLPARHGGRWIFSAPHLGIVVRRGLLLHTLPPVGGHVRRYGPMRSMPEAFWRWRG